jgi:hypothetical protein
MVYVASNGSDICEVESMLKEAVVAYFKVLFYNRLKWAKMSDPQAEYQNQHLPNMKQVW